GVRDRSAELAALRRQPVDGPAARAVAADGAQAPVEQARSAGAVAAAPRDRLSRGASGRGHPAADPVRPSEAVPVVFQPRVQDLDRAGAAPMAAAGADRQGQADAAPSPSSAPPSP